MMRRLRRCIAPRLARRSLRSATLITLFGAKLRLWSFLRIKLLGPDAGGLNIELVWAPSADAVIVRLAVIIFVADSKRSSTAVAHPLILHVRALARCVVGMDKAAILCRAMGLWSAGR
jgi:hypothetical protein